LANPRRGGIKYLLFNYIIVTTIGINFGILRLFLKLYIELKKEYYYSNVFNNLKIIRYLKTSYHNFIRNQSILKFIDIDKINFNGRKIIINKKTGW
jgi:hypothetical protein